MMLLAWAHAAQRWNSFSRCQLEKRRKLTQGEEPSWVCLCLGLSVLSVGGWEPAGSPAGPGQNLAVRGGVGVRS